MALMEHDVESALAPRQTRRLAVSGLALIAVAYGLARFAYGLFVPSFREEFGLDPSAVGLIGSLSYAAYCVAIYPAMMLTPRAGSRLLAVVAGALATLGTGMVGLAPSAVVLAAGIVLAGLSTGLASPPLAHAVALRVASSRRDRVQAIINSGTGLGVALSGPVALLTLSHWRLAWVAFAVVALVVTLSVARTVPAMTATTPRVEPAETAGSRWHGLRRLLPEPLLPAGAARLHATAALLGIATAAMWVFGQDVITEVGNLGATVAVLSWSALGICGLAGAGAGDLAHRLGLRAAWALCALIIAASTAMLGLFPSAVVVSFGASALFGPAYIASSGLLLICAATTYQRQPAAGVGLAFLTLAAGQSVGGALLGGLLGSAGAGWSFGLAALIAAASAAWAPTRRAPDPGRGECGPHAARR